MPLLAALVDKEPLLLADQKERVGLLQSVEPGRVLAHPAVEGIVRFYLMKM